MNWIFLTLLAQLVYTVNVFADKYIIESKLPDFRSLPIFTSILAFVFILILGLLTGFNLLSFKDGSLVVLSGILTIWAFGFYLEALIKEEGSIIVLLMQLIPVLVLVFSYLFLKETINTNQFLGFVLLFFSSFLASFKKMNSKFKFSEALVFMLLADVLWSIPYILIKNASSEISFKDLVFYESIGVVLGGIMLFLVVSKVKKAFLKTISKIKKPVIGLIFLNECFFLLGKVLTYLAVMLGPAALVSILGSTQIFFAIFAGIFLTFLMPKIFKEEISKKALIKKTFLGLTAVLGIYLLS